MVPSTIKQNGTKPPPYPWVFKGFKREFSKNLGISPALVVGHNSPKIALTPRGMSEVSCCFVLYYSEPLKIHFFVGTPQDSL